MPSLSRVARLAFPSFAVLLVGTLVAACSSAPSGHDEWTGQTSSDVACQGAGIHPADCPIGKPNPPQPTVTLCPAGVTCSSTAGNLASPVGAACAAPEYVTETDAAGTTVDAYMAMFCNTTGAYAAVVEGWMASQPASWNVHKTPSV